MTTPHVISKLNEHLGRADAVRFEIDEHDLTRAVLRHAGSEAHVYLHGAHVSHYQPAGHQPVLMLSERSDYGAGSALRGGVPVCFPWFSKRDETLHGPWQRTEPPTGHGIVRTRAWKVKATDADDQHAMVSFVFRWSPRVYELWPHRFEALFVVRLDDGLSMSLTVKNIDDKPLTYEQALHTYYAVGDIERTTLTGLANATYHDKVRDHATFTQADEPLRFTGPIDSVYQDTRGPCVIHDGALKREIHISPSHASSTIVWNPWTEGAKKMADLADDDWQRMLCVETANVARHAITLAPDESHTMKSHIHVHRPNEKT